MSDIKLPSPSGFQIHDGIIDVSHTHNSFKFERISSGINPLYLNNTHYFIEIDNPDTKTVILPAIDLLPAIQYIIRKKFIGELTIIPNTINSTIENKTSIILRSPDQIIKLFNDTLNTWIIL